MKVKRLNQDPTQNKFKFRKQARQLHKKFKTNPRKQMVRDKFPRRVRRASNDSSFLFQILEIKQTSTDDTEIYLLAFLK